MSAVFDINDDGLAFVMENAKVDENLDDVKGYTRAISRVIYSYIKENKFNGIVDKPIKEIGKKIHRLEDAIKKQDENNETE